MSNQDFSILQNRIDELADQFLQETGLGLCAPVACVLRERGHGRLAYGTVPYKGRKMGHYWNVGPSGEIMDGTAKWYGLDGNYIEMQGILEDDEVPPLSCSQEVLDWWRERI